MRNLTENLMEDLIVNVVPIEHAEDARVNQFRRVKDAASKSAGLFLVESELVIQRLLETNVEITAILVSPNRFERLVPAITEAENRRPTLTKYGTQNQSKTQIFVCEQPVLEAIVGFPLHRGCLAICRRRPLPEVEVVLADAKTVVVLDDVVDPDNLGSVFRHVAGFGVDAIVLSAHAGDPLYRKSVRASMGWVLEVPYARLSSRESLLPVLHGLGFVTIALTPRREAQSLRSVVASLKPSDRVALLLGAEAPGLPAETITGATYSARIPMTTHVDSLNVATSGALALYELVTAHPNRIISAGKRKL